MVNGVKWYSYSVASVGGGRGATEISWKLMVVICTVSQIKFGLKTFVERRSKRELNPREKRKVSRCERTLRNNSDDNNHEYS